MAYINIADKGFIMSFYTLFPQKQFHQRVRHLNNRDLAILFGVFLGAGIATYGILSEHFSSIAVLGSALGNHNWCFKLLAILLSAGTFGNLLSYVGSCIDIITNHRTIFDLFPKKDNCEI